MKKLKKNKMKENRHSFRSHKCNYLINKYLILAMKIKSKDLMCQ